ncbi:hypothetical protein LCGC14_0950490 [marine sediment metagenome]|uniref:Uncharacterized protein n=1 Tax=marine sediment metagenome TaxID=412755 RepID=A0A0F9NM41_9ZZZZ
MSEFLHEDGVSAKAQLPKRHAKKQLSETEGKAPKAPRGRRRPAKARPPGRFDPALDLFMRDFKAGVSRLRGLTDRLSERGKSHQPEFKSDRPSKPSPIQPAALKRHMPPSIAKIMEREIRLVSEKVPQAVHVHREYQTRVQSVVQQQLPQIYAAILRAERETRKMQATSRPASVALRPGQPGVQSLMRAAKAIRSGRLPFLDRSTKKEAQQLLGRIWGTKRAETRRLIEQHRLIPLAVREDIVQSVHARAHKAGWRQDPRSSRSEPPAKFIREIEREIIKLLPSPRWDTSKGQSAAPVPVAAHDIPRLQQQGVPSFQTEGVAAGGSYVVDPGENVHVITRDGNPLDRADDTGTSPPPPAAPRQQRRDRGAPAAAPQATRHAPPPTQRTGASQTTGGLGAETGGGAAGGQRGPVELRGRLEIPGLANWIADIEGRLEDRG